jgi:hypothetical protein
MGSWVELQETSKIAALAASERKNMDGNRSQGRKNVIS